MEKKKEVKEKKKKASGKNKEIVTLVLIILFFVLIRFVLLYIGAKLGETRENELIQLKMSALTEIVSNADTRRAAAAEHMSVRLSANTELMTTMLKEFCEDDDYTGPRSFPDGFVAELRSGRVILPPEAQTYAAEITKETVEEGLESGRMIMATRGEGTANKAQPVHEQNAEEPNDACYFRFGRISENYVYVDLLSEREYTEYLNRYSGVIDEVLETAADSYGGVTLLVGEEDGRFQVERQFGSVEGFESLSAETLDEAVRTPSSVLTLNGKDYQCASSKLDDTGMEKEDVYVLQIIPQVSLREQNVSRTLIVVLLMVIIFLAATVYVVSAQHVSASRDPADEEAKHYHPDKMRKRMITVGILGVVVVFVVALLVESVGQLYMELRYGRDTLRLFAGQVEKENADQISSISREEEAWYVFYGEEMAGLFSAYPELAAPAKLQKYCEILNIDTIMLFDSKGSETACSRDYVGFTLGSSPEDALYDFRRLLHGVPSIVHEASVNTVTGHERQLIGVKIPSREPGELHGALVMALLPDCTDGSRLAMAYDRTLTLETARGTQCFAADVESGEILYASGVSVLGKMIGEIGLPENSLQDGYMDFTTIEGTKVLVITVREGECVYYYAVESETMFGRVLLYGALAALLFAIVLALLLVFLLRGDNEKAMDELTELVTHDHPQIKHLSTDKMDAVTIVPEAGPEEESGEKTGLAEKILELLRWHQRKPGQRSTFVLHLGIIVLILCCLDVLGGKSISNENYDTMFGFLLNGDWMRGLNLFSLCSCLMIVSIAYLINLAASLILKLTGILFSGHGETICRLIYSCIKYITLLGVLYFCLEYLGFPTSTILAALASVSLAVSLGAQDLIADILAGLAIVFDGSFKVGDVVEINGRKGTVLELGVRATRMRIPVNNIYVINNHEIKDILDLSKEYSECRVDIQVSTKYSITELRETLTRELSALNGKESRILYGPYLIGVTKLPGNAFVPAVTLSIGAMNEEKDDEEITRYLNEELKLIAEREGIELI